MKVVSVLVHTGVEDRDLEIKEKLTNTLKDLEVEFSDMHYQVVITLPEYVNRFSEFPILLLTDDNEAINTYSNVMDYTPIPISNDDFLRIEFRLAGIVHNIRMSDESGV